MATIDTCPSTDHDGAIAPATRHVTAGNAAGITVDVSLCAYCAEGRVARLLRDGFTVTLTPLDAA